MMYGFQDCAAFPDRPDVQQRIAAAIRRNLPDALNIHRAAMDNDKMGVDYFIEFQGAQMRTLDVKARRQDYALKGQPSICLEIWSNYETKKVGWTRDPKKITDYILFYWHESQASMLVDFHRLRPLFDRDWQDWRMVFGSSIQKNKNYTSESLFITPRELSARLYREYDGRKAPTSV